MKREQILSEALPYIREFYGSFVVIKIGGHAMIDNRLMEGIIEDIVLLRYVGMQPVLVHGVDPRSARRWSGWVKKPEFAAGLRITDEETLEIAAWFLWEYQHAPRRAHWQARGKGVGLSGEGRTYDHRAEKRSSAGGL